MWQFLIQLQVLANKAWTKWKQQIINIFLIDTEQSFLEVFSKFEMFGNIFDFD